MKIILEKYRAELNVQNIKKIFIWTLFTRDIFAHNIAIKYIFGPWISTGQGKLFKKSRYVFSKCTLVGH